MEEIERDRLLKVRNKIFNYVRENHPENMKPEECAIEVTECFPALVTYEGGADNVLIDLYTKSFNSVGADVVHTFSGSNFHDAISDMNDWIDGIIRDGIPVDDEEFDDDIE